MRHRRDARFYHMILRADTYRGLPERCYNGVVREDCASEGTDIEASETQNHIDATSRPLTSGHHPLTDFW